MPWHAFGAAKAAATPAANSSTWLLLVRLGRAGAVQRAWYLETEGGPTAVSEGQHQASRGEDSLMGGEMEV